MDFIILPPLTVLDIVGSDAARVLNNLCTAAVLPLNPGEGCEAFITEVRGRTLGHLCVYRLEDRLRLIGAAGQAVTIAAHLDRYTIREDATAEDLSERWSGLLLDEACLRRLDPSWQFDPPATPQLLAWKRLVPVDTPAGEDNRIAYSIPWTGDGRWLIAAPHAEIEQLANRLQASGAMSLDEAAFHRQRVSHRFPWFGLDLDDRNLPQEADRDALAISFTKGCYLGQETVARLDALGQVQKKLVQWRFSGSERPAVGAELSHDGRVVGRLSSVVDDPESGDYLALGFARRSHFEPGAEAELPTESGKILRATVI